MLYKEDKHYMLLFGVIAVAFIYSAFMGIPAIILLAVGVLFGYKYYVEWCILRKGVRLTGLIVDYSDGHRVVNNNTELVIVVMYHENDKFKVIFIPTLEYSEERFPLGTYIEISLYEGKARLTDRQCWDIPEKLPIDDAIRLWHHAYGENSNPEWITTNTNT